MLARAGLIMLNKYWGSKMPLNDGMMSQLVAAHRGPEQNSNLPLGADDQSYLAKKAGVTNRLVDGMFSGFANAAGANMAPGAMPSMDSNNEQGKAIMKTAYDSGAMKTAEGLQNVAAQLGAVGLKAEAMKMLALADTKAGRESDEKFRNTKEAARLKQQATTNTRLDAQLTVSQGNLALALRRLENAESQEERVSLAADLKESRLAIAKDSATQMANKAGDHEFAEALANGSMTPSQYWQQDINRRSAERAAKQAEKVAAALKAGKKPPESRKTNSPAPKGFQERLELMVGDWGPKAGNESEKGFFFGTNDSQEKKDAAVQEVWSIWDNSPPGTPMVEAINRFIAGAGINGERAEDNGELIFIDTQTNEVWRTGKDWTPE